jgi:hypothetical protein
VTPTAPLSATPEIPPPPEAPQSQTVVAPQPPREVVLPPDVPGRQFVLRIPQRDIAVQEPDYLTRPPSWSDSPLGLEAAHDLLEAGHLGGQSLPASTSGGDPGPGTLPLESLPDLHKPRLGHRVRRFTLRVSAFGHTHQRPKRAPAIRQGRPEASGGSLSRQILDRETGLVSRVAPRPWKPSEEEWGALPRKTSGRPQTWARVRQSRLALSTVPR